jgi:hypothetical protein
MAAWLVLCLSTPLLGQTAQPSTDSTDVLVLDHDFATGGEIVRVFLGDMQVYRAELSSQDVTLQIRARFSGMKALRTYPILDSQSPSGSSIVEIYPDQDGEYEIRPVSIQGSRISTRLRLYRDVSESRRRVASAGKRGWEAGVELAGAFHSGFSQSSVTPAIGSEPSGGTDVEACLSARSTSKTPRFGMCVLGVSNQSQRGAPGIVWVYTEPRLGVLRTDATGFSSWEMGALLRFGVGISSRSSSPTLFGPGVFLARNIRSSLQGTGWSFQLSYTRAFFKSFKKPLGGGDAFVPSSNRISFGVGWYK